VWTTVKDIFLSKPNHELLSYLPYLVCGLQHFHNLHEFRMAFGNHSFWDHNKPKPTVITRISITIFHSVVSYDMNLFNSVTSILTNLNYIKPKYDISLYK